MTQLYNRSLDSPLHDRSPHCIQQHSYKANRPQQLDRPASFSIRDSEDYGRKINQPLSPMSDHKNGQEVSTPRVGEMYQKSQASTQKPREQLPPLSSLFGSPSSHSRPIQSPYSDRHSPVFPTQSPNELRLPATPLRPDRLYEASYFQRPPVSGQYTNEARSEHVDRQEIPPPPRPSSLGQRPASPRYEGRQGILEGPRTQAPGSVNGWSPHSQSSQSDYFPRDEAASFRSQLERHPPQLTIHRHEPEARQAYRSAPGPAPYPPTPASTVTGDVGASKDALGPKIWTGTQFLPRFVRQAEVAGEGMCYFYDDGTHCRTVIDGEIVNAHWGVTKAGKPRKRLAIACITCREKKIKCDPDYPRCVQCEKFGRICKFKNAPRGGQGSPDTPPADGEDMIPRPSSSRTDGESLRSEKREHSQSVSPRQILRNGTPDSEQSIKRQRTGYSEFTPVASQPSPKPSLLEAATPLTPWIEHSPSTAMDRNLTRDWHTNPYTTHPILVSELMTVVFKHVPETAYCMFPEGPFKLWVLSHNEKSADDLMLVYSMLALATIFSPKSEHKSIGAHFAAIARHACDARNYTLQLVQARLMLALYCFASNKPNDAWDFCGSAIRTACGLRLNLEVEKTDEAYLQAFPYGLNRSGYAESRRRTFWSCYNMDRYNGFCTGRLCIIQPEDIFLRLPCDFTLFESQAQVQAPYFDPTTPPLQSATWTIGSMAYLINITTIWGDVMANIYRAAQRPYPLTSNSAFMTFYESVVPRLHAWRDSLPPSYSFSPSNLKIAADSGKLGTFMTMHTVYHTICLKLHRHVQKANFTAAQLAHHVLLSKQHAESIIAIMDALAARRSTTTPSRSTEHDIAPGKFSSPFLGYAMVAAIDVLSAKFPLTSVPTLLSSFEGSLSILVELAKFWNASRMQHAMITKRLRDLAELTSTGEDLGRAISRLGTMREKDGFFLMRDSLEKQLSRDFDCIYV